MILWFVYYRGTINVHFYWPPLSPCLKDSGCAKKYLEFPKRAQVQCALGDRFHFRFYSEVGAGPRSFREAIPYIQSNLARP